MNREEQENFLTKQDFIYLRFVPIFYGFLYDIVSSVKYLNVLRTSVSNVIKTTRNATKSVRRIVKVRIQLVTKNSYKSTKH